MLTGGVGERARCSGSHGRGAWAGPSTRGGPPAASGQRIVALGLFPGVAFRREHLAPSAACAPDGGVFGVLGHVDGHLVAGAGLTFSRGRAG